MNNPAIQAAMDRTSKAMLEARRLRDERALAESRLSKKEYLARYKEIEKKLNELARTSN